MQCTNGHDNPDGQKFCGECGAPIGAPDLDAADVDAAETPSEPAAPDPSSHPTLGTNEADGIATTPPHRGRRRIWIGSIAAAVALVVIVAIASGGDDTSEKAKRASGETHSSVVSNDLPLGTNRTTPTTEPAAHEVTVAGNGFTQLPPDSIGSSYLSYGVIVQNPSHDIATRVSLNVAFYNDAGVVVKADNPTIDVILPGQTAAYGQTLQADGATRMEVQALVGNWQTPTNTVGAFTASGVSTTARQYSGLQTNATLSSTFAKDLKEVVAVAIYRDASGAIVGGDRTYVDFVPAGGQAAVEITSFSDMPAPAATDVYAELSNLSLLGT